MNSDGETGDLRETAASGHFSIPDTKNNQADIYTDADGIIHVKTAFLGFPIRARKHHIVILYHSPGIKIGRLLSLMGMVLAIVCIRPQ